MRWFSKPTFTSFPILTGLAISVAVFLQGYANMFIMSALWILYHSLVNVGQRWYSFGELRLLFIKYHHFWKIVHYIGYILIPSTNDFIICFKCSNSYYNSSCWHSPLDLPTLKIKYESFQWSVNLYHYFPYCHDWSLANV